MIRSPVLSRRALCLSAVGALTLGTAGCGNPAATSAAVSLAISLALRSQFAGKIGALAIDLVATAADVMTIIGAVTETVPPQSEQLRVSQKRYDDFMAMPATSHAVYDTAIPTFDAYVTNTTGQELNAAQVSAVWFATDGSIIEEVVHPDYVNLVAYDSKRLDGSFKFERVTPGMTGYVAIRTNQDGIIGEQKSLIALAPRSSISV